MPYMVLILTLQGTVRYFVHKRLKFAEFKSLFLPSVDWKLSPEDKTS